MIFDGEGQSVVWLNALVFLGPLVVIAVISWIGSARHNSKRAIVRRLQRDGYLPIDHPETDASQAAATAPTKSPHQHDVA